MPGKKLLQRAFIASAIVNVILICLLGYFQSNERITVARANINKKKAIPSPGPSAMAIGVERMIPSPVPSSRPDTTQKPTAKSGTPKDAPTPSTTRTATRSQTRVSSSPTPNASPSAGRGKPAPTPSPNSHEGQGKNPATALAASPRPDSSKNAPSKENGTEGKQKDSGTSANSGTPSVGNGGGDKVWQGQPMTGSQAASVRSQIASSVNPRPNSPSANSSPNPSPAGNGVKAGTYRFVPPSTAASGSAKEASANKIGTDAKGSSTPNAALTAGTGKTGTGGKNGTGDGKSAVNGITPNSTGNPTGPAGGPEGAKGSGRTRSGNGANGNATGQGNQGTGSTAAGGRPNGSMTGNPSNRSGDGPNGQNNGGGSGTPSSNGYRGGADDAGYRYNAPGLPSASRPEPNRRAGALLQPRPRPTPTPRPTVTPTATPTVAPSPTPIPQASPTPHPTPKPSPSPTPKPKATPDPEPDVKQIAGSYSKRGTIVVDAAKVVAKKPKSKKPVVKKPKASPSPSPTPSPKPSVSPTPTPTPTSTPTPRPTATPKPTPKPSATPPPHLQGDGTGLKADYYLGANFEKFLFSRADPKIEFEWQQGSPDARVPAKNAWSVRWTGRVRPQYSDEYTFFTAADDGTRVWVNGQQLINDWTIHGVSEVSGKIRLEGGKLYDIRVEFFEKNGESFASCKVYWESARQKREFIPQTAFYFPQ